MHWSWQGSIQVWFLWTNQNVMISKVTNEFASFCRDNILHQNYGYFLWVCLNGERLRSTSLWLKQTKFLWFVCLLYKTNWFHVAVRLFSNRSQKTSKCGKNISGKWSDSWVCHCDIIRDLLLNRCTTTVESIS